MTDTHTHIYLSNDYPGQEAGEALERAVAAGVRRMIFPSVALASLDAMLQLHDYSPEHTDICIGLHPTELTDEWKNDWERMHALMSGRKIVGVGETGMDLYRDSSYLVTQRQAFDFQARFALQTGLPLIIHSRSALEETLDVLKNLPEMPQAVFHSFTGSPAEAEAILAAGDFYFGINGVATFKNAAPLREALHVIPRERILLETDAPWLSPTPLRGRRNESSYIIHTAEVVANELGMSFKEIEHLTDENAARLFSTSHTL